MTFGSPRSILALLGWKGRRPSSVGISGPAAAEARPPFHLTRYHAHAAVPTYGPPLASGRQLRPDEFAQAPSPPFGARSTLASLPAQGGEGAVERAALGAKGEPG